MGYVYHLTMTSPLVWAASFSVDGTAAILRVAPVCCICGASAQEEKERQTTKVATSSLVAALLRFCATVLLRY